MHSKSTSYKALTDSGDLENMKILITTRGDYVSPRFDQSTEIVIAICYDEQLLEDPHSIIISRASAEKICDLALQEKVAIVICGGIEDQHYQFLNWKKIRVIDSVIGPYSDILKLAVHNRLQPGTILPGVVTREVVP